jgi:ubiquinone/menaquinone biosynthesis C-methylase UbiE
MMTKPHSGRWTSITLLTLTIAPLAAQAPKDQHEMHGLHKDTAAYIKALEDPKRDAYQKPHEVMTALALKPGEVIADIGAGSGYFTFRVAQHVGPTGRVFAVDINQEMLDHIKQRMRDLKVSNVSTILGRPNDPLLPEPVDRFLIVDVWHHIEDQPGFLAVMKKHLKPGGQVVMIDFHKRDLPVGPPAAMKIAREDLLKQMLANGLELAAEHTFLPYQYFLVFKVRA